MPHRLYLPKEHRDEIKGSPHSIWVGPGSELNNPVSLWGIQDRLVTKASARGRVVNLVELAEIKKFAREARAEAFARMMLDPGFIPYYKKKALRIAALIPLLKGKNLACDCSIHWPCHGDVLLKLANVQGEALQSYRAEVLEKKLDPAVLLLA